MQIVIDIPDERYKKLVNPYQYNEALCDELKTIVKNGTILPKGHGRLKDADSIKTAFPNGEYVRTESVRATIDHEETIIEADVSKKKKGTPFEGNDSCYNCENWIP